MAILRIPDEKRSIANLTEVRDYLASIGIEYERWDLASASPDASPEQILDAYSQQIALLKARGGYVTEIGRASCRERVYDLV